MLLIFFQQEHNYEQTPRRNEDICYQPILKRRIHLKISKSLNVSRTTVYAWIQQRNNSFNKGKAPNFRYLHNLEQKCKRQQKMIEILKRSPYSPRAPLSKRFEVIKALSFEYNVNTLCEALDVAKGSYYNHLLRNKNGNTKTARKQSEMTPIIEQIFQKFSEAVKFMQY